jgi:glycosyltransferase involved in cell wall biosynthesis
MAGIWVQFGHALKESGDLKAAETAYRRSLEINELNADTHLQLGHVLKLQNRRQEAMSAYVRAAGLDAACISATHEIGRLARQGISVPAAVLEMSGPSRQDETEADARVWNTDAQMIVFDVSDLLSYFGNARLPTGIQRVQIEVVSSMLLSSDPAKIVRVCAYSEMVDDWVLISKTFFLNLCELSLRSGDRKEAEWLEIMRILGFHLLTAPKMQFKDGAALINIGTSWWLQNYFLNLRKIKRDHHVYYIPFVHDLIPIMTPEHCIKELTQDFIAWTLGVFHHADLFLAASEATRRDLITVAALLGHQKTMADVAVIPLNADFRPDTRGTLNPALPGRWGLEPGKFVLFVSTIESRKNHVAAFETWLDLIQNLGADSTPKLVCVGNPGWLNDAVHSKLRSNDALRQHVVMLSHISDDDLRSLYENCLFTIYPSLYEGWGLPVTESLCYGKIPLISDGSSLPEAGGRFAEYFELGNEHSFTVAAERLILDHDYRREREADIAEHFKPRAWAEVGAQVAAAAARFHPKTGSGSLRPLVRAVEPMPADLATYYPITRNFERRVWRGMVAGEMFRTGAGWWWPDDWGSWTKAAGGEISLALKGRHAPLRIYIRIRGAPAQPSDWVFEVARPLERRMAGTLNPEEYEWLVLDLPASKEGTTFQAKLSGCHSEDLGGLTHGADQRVVSVGVAGFYICEAGDLSARMAFAEAAGMGSFRSLTPGHEQRDASYSVRSQALKPISSLPS